VSQQPTVETLVSHWQRCRQQGQPLTPEQLCADCPELLPEVRQQIDAVANMEALLEARPNLAAETAVPGSSVVPPCEQPTRATSVLPGLFEVPDLPAYAIEGLLGQGGMGIVYRARQKALDRTVALKMIRAGSRADAEDLQRFKTEAEAVARLRHPNIVQIYEVGTHQGRPYFSMEYCAGGSLQTRLAGTPLPPRDAAALVETLARAMAVAHEHHIIHRDLKPGNILLAEVVAQKTEDRKQKTEGKGQRTAIESGRQGPRDADPTGRISSPSAVHFPLPSVVRITDFGLAKKLDADSQQTRTGAVLGTPSYMAPEQARGDHATSPLVDVYALGAILYEVLTGRPPFKASTSVETIMLVTTQDPVPVRRLQPQVPRDLETICLKCLEKDPARRYPNAAALAEDLRRFQKGEPILARPTGAVERVVKWARRRPAVAVLSLVTVVVALLGLAGVVLSWREAVHQERQAALNAANETEARIAAQRAEAAARQNAQKEQAARLEAEEAKARAVAAAKEAVAAAAQRTKVAEFMTGLFETVDPIGLDGYGLRASNESGQKLTARQLLDRGARQIKTGTDLDPLTRATLLDTIGHVYRSLSLYDEAEGLLKEALTIRRDLLPADDPLLATSLHHLGWWYYDRGNLPQAEKLYRDALAIRLKRLGPMDPATVATKINLGWLLSIKGDFDQAVTVLKEVLAVRKELYPHKSREVAIAQLGLAAVLLDRGDRSLEVYALVQPALKTLAELEGDASITIAVAHFQNGVMAQSRGLDKAAVQDFQKTLDAAIPFLGKDHAFVGAILYQMGVSLEALRDFAGAEAAYAKSVEICRKTVSLAHPKSMLPVARLAQLLGRAKRVQEGERLLQEMLDVRRARLDPDDVAIAEALAIYANFQSHFGDASRAGPLYAAAADIFSRNQVFRLEVYYLALVGHGELLLNEGAYCAAETSLRTALALEKRQAGDDDERAALRAALAANLLAQDKYEEAVPWLREAAKAQRAAKNWSALAQTYLNLSRAEATRGELAGAADDAREALRLGRTLVFKQHLRLLPYLEQLANVQACAGKVADARLVQRELWGLLRDHSVTNPPYQADCAHKLALLELAGQSHAGFTHYCDDLADLAEGGDEQVTALLLATAVLAPERLADPKHWLAAAEQLVQRYPDNAAYHDALGALLDAASKHEEAIVALTLAGKKEDGAVAARNAALLARAYVRTGNRQKARQSLDRARQVRKTAGPPAPRPSAGQWVEAMETDLLLGEVEALLEGRIRRRR
jgi:serine/threonine protein kinase/Tfp pilus assembly protein PilX